jgi:hypothetical protein
MLVLDHSSLVQCSFFFNYVAQSTKIVFRVGQDHDVLFFVLARVSCQDRMFYVGNVYKIVFSIYLRNNKTIVLLFHACCESLMHQNMMLRSFFLEMGVYPSLCIKMMHMDFIL